jgi:phospholipid/cholesterol/gamma-HCH transport system substrate-binding protein
MKRPAGSPLIKNLEIKVGALLLATVLLVAGFVLYAMYARGAFHQTQNLTLIAPEADGVSIGMPMTFSGFPIGTVKRMELSEDGNVRLEIAIPSKDARWLRENSIFTLEKGFIGGAKIKAHTANLKDQPLADGASRTLLTGDAAEEIPVLMEKLKAILNNIADMTGKESRLNQTLANVQSVTHRMTGEYGVLESVLGGPEKAQQVVAALEKTNALLSSLNGVSLKVDAVLAKTDSRFFGAQGIMDQAQESVAKLNAILSDARDSLKKADALLANAQAASADLPIITGNVREATADMTNLRTEIDDSVRKVNHLINEINKKWPFARDVEIKTP